MTNFEWLVKTNRYNKFVEDFNYMGELSFRERYDIQLRYSGFSISMDVLMWLSQERKEPERYVRLKDVLEIMHNANDMFKPMWDIHGKFKYEIPINYVAKWYDDKMDKIKHLEYKTEEENLK